MDKSLESKTEIPKVQILEIPRKRIDKDFEEVEYDSYPIKVEITPRSLIKPEREASLNFGNLICLAWSGIIVYPLGKYLVNYLVNYLISN